MRTEPVLHVDPMTASCPDCSALPEDPCIRLSGPYGIGTPLRRPHPARRRRAVENARAELDRALRAARANPPPT